jgi:sec-independent protein translocase protein TatA
VKEAAKAQGSRKNACNSLPGNIISGKLFGVFRFFLGSLNVNIGFCTCFYIYLYRSHFKKNVMGNLGFQEILLIAVVVLVLFGGRKIPEFMRGLGRGVREFNDAKDNVKKELEDGIKEKDQPKQQTVNTTAPTTHE